MPKTRSSLLIRACGVRGRALAGCSVMLLAIGCDERDRLTFPPPNDGVGPVTTIEQPNASDTTIFPGADFLVSGQSTDPDGIDTVYFFVIAGSQGFNPVHPNPVKTTVSFGIQLRTFGHSGETFLVEIYGVDALGNRGESSTRHINIR
jgi:hypothetical protein